MHNSPNYWAEYLKRSIFCFNWTGKSHNAPRSCIEYGNKHHASICNKIDCTLPDSTQTPREEKSHSLANRSAGTVLHIMIKGMVNGREVQIMIINLDGSSRICSNLVTNLNMKPICKEHSAQNKTLEPSRSWYRFIVWKSIQVSVTGLWWTLIASMEKGMSLLIYLTLRSSYWKRNTSDFEEWNFVMKIGQSNNYPFISYLGQLNIRIFDLLSHQFVEIIQILIYRFGSR